MFTRKEFFLFWLPSMLLGAVIFSSQVAIGRFSTPAAIVLMVILGITLKVAARLFNPPAAKPESETENEVTPE